MRLCLLTSKSLCGQPQGISTTFLEVLSLLADSSSHPPPRPPPSPVDPGVTGVALGLFTERPASLLSWALSFFLSRPSCLWHRVWPIYEQLVRDHFLALYGNPANILVTYARKISITGMSGLGFGILSRRLWRLRRPFALFHSPSQGDSALGTTSLNLT